MLEFGDVAQDVDLQRDIAVRLAPAAFLPFIKPTARLGKIVLSNKPLGDGPRHHRLPTRVTKLAACRKRFLERR